MRSTFTQSDFAQIAYPISNPGMTWVEPADIGNRNLPLAHLEDKSNDYRLFGINASLPTLMPHELGHIYHSAALTDANRLAIEASYAAYIAINILNPHHGINFSTSPFIVFIEVLGTFSKRFYFFAKLVEPNLSGLRFRQAFWRDELSA
jgi:hypothetical protein